MCGLAGIVSRSNIHNAPSLVQSAIATLKHRGPDGTAITDNVTHVALGHARLCIIDLSTASAQPFRYLNRYLIIHNGELYNYLELREQLKRDGQAFRTESDTEVIVAAFAAWGTKCLQRFDGMFAFAIWDEQEQKLFAARDRFGEKPFFFSHDDERLVFASEMKALWEMGVQKEVNRGMLYNFLNIGYTSNPEDPHETFFNNVQKLPAASFLTYSVSTGELQVEKYWQVFIEENQNISEQDAIHQFQHLFSESVKKRLRADVAIGTSLSGGLDSSAVVAFCEKNHVDRYTQSCFTAVFPGFDRNEQEYASLIVKAFRQKHHLVEIDEHELTDLMDKTSYHQEEPFSSASVLAQFKVYDLAKKSGVTVLLDGQGADEILAGYHKYYRWYWQELYRNRRLNKSQELEQARKMNVSEDFGLRHKIAALLPEFTASLLQSRKEKHAFRNTDLNRDFAFGNKRNLYYATPATFDLNGALYFNTFVHGLDELLRLADRNSMAHGTEVRLPFLSHALVEFLFSLPPHFKIRNGWTKWLLRKSVDDLLPPEITWRKDKVGFEPPQKKWMQNKQVQDRIIDAKKTLVDHGILDSSVLQKTIVPKSAHDAASFDWRYWSASYLFK